MDTSFIVALVSNPDPAVIRKVAELSIVAWGRPAADAEVTRRAQILSNEIAVPNPSHRAMFVAIAGDRIVGASRIMPDGDSAAAWVFYGLVVHPDHRRKGLGRALATAALNHARQHGARSIRADVHVWNEGSISFHHALGFESDGAMTDADGDKIVRFRWTAQTKVENTK